MIMMSVTMMILMTLKKMIQDCPIAAARTCCQFPGKS